MTINYDTLIELQKVLAQMFEIEDKIKDIPRDLNDKEAVLQKTKLDYLDLSNKCESLSAEVEDIYKRYIEAGQTKEAKEKQMELTTLSREYENLAQEIEQAKASEQNLLKVYNARKKYLEELQLKLQVSADIVASQTQEVEEETEKKDSLIAEQNQILEDIKGKKDELSKDLSKNLLFKFERIIRNKGGVGVVPIHGIICQGCHMELPQQFANDVRKDEDIHFCPYCSRILYYEPSEEDEKFDNAVHGDIHADEEEGAETASDFISSDDNLFED
ncbi:MAG: DNA-binding protein [Sphaerochaetaceae bacterium]|nr:DNA-binding protein [Sphaerochaetaceae bacterium]